LGVIQALKDYHISPKIYETTFKHEQAFKDVSQQLERVQLADPPRIVSGLTLNRINIQYPFHLAGIRYCINKCQRTIDDVL
ncbi:Sucrose operon repressor, partial [human gut metagenome]